MANNGLQRIAKLFAVDLTVSAGGDYHVLFPVGVTRYVIAVACPLAGSCAFQSSFPVSDQQVVLGIERVAAPVHPAHVTGHHQRTLEARVWTPPAGGRVVTGWARHA
jgi:hypothetical protein